MPEDKKICHFADLYFKYGVKGDKSIVFVTDELIKFPFPERKRSEIFTRKCSME